MSITAKLNTVRKHRLVNLRVIIERETATKLAKLFGHKSTSYLSQVAGPNPIRPITENQARFMESRLGLPAGALDADPYKLPTTKFAKVAPAGHEPTLPVSPTAVDVERLTACIKEVMAAQNTAGIPAEKLAGVVAAAYSMRSSGDALPVVVGYLLAIAR